MDYRMYFKRVLALLLTLMMFLSGMPTALAEAWPGWDVCYAAHR